MQNTVTKAILYQGRNKEGELFWIPVKLLSGSSSQKLVALLG